MCPQDISDDACSDSFFYSGEVKDKDTWTYKLEAIMTGVESLNFRIGG